jgi:CRP/FNR family transcriptional regulator
MDEPRELTEWVNEFQQEVGRTGPLAERKAKCHTCLSAPLCLPGNVEDAAVSALECLVEEAGPLPAGHEFLRAGDAFDAIFAVKAGMVKTYRIDQQGDVHITGFVLPGELIGLDALAGDRHAQHAVTVTTSMLCRISFPRISQLSQHWPSLQLQMFRLFSQALRAPQFAQGEWTAETRLAAFLIDLGERWKRRGFSCSEFQLDMPRQDLAAYLGLAPETLSRLFKRFGEEGLLKSDRRHVRLTDWTRLQQLAAPLLR